MHGLWRNKEFAQHPSANQERTRRHQTSLHSEPQSDSSTLPTEETHECRHTLDKRHNNGMPRPPTTPSDYQPILSLPATAITKKRTFRILLFSWRCLACPLYRHASLHHTITRHTYVASSPPLPNPNLHQIWIKPLASLRRPAEEASSQPKETRIQIITDRHMYARPGSTSRTTRS